MEIQEYQEEMKLNVSGCDPTWHELVLCNKGTRTFRSLPTFICYRVCYYVESYIHTRFQGVVCT